MASQANQALPAGSRLENYRVVRTLASGGFSFVYLAHDENEAPVVIKEYLPSTLAVRTDGDAAPKVAAGDLARFRYGMKCFFEEGRALARLQHPNVVRVVNFFRANDTVYLVMRYERGRSLDSHIRARRGLPDEVWLRSTFAQLLNGLREVHSNKLLHLDIKPANVYLRDDDSPILLDFGAARQTLSAEGVKLPPTYTPGYAAPEQYARPGELGPWSDIYSVGATVYSCCAGAAPQAAHERLAKDRLSPARRAWADRYSAVLLDTVDWCLRLDHLERPQSVLALQKALLGEKEPERRGRAPLLHRALKIGRK
ncbi:MAG: serine/threonine protein kinase [Betaproteobacteria bacterium]|nr:MAG: serine/threonine protein kinase [Betaproteobacteria bacterium]